MEFCLAPMDGITDCAYRIIVKKIFEKYNNKDNLLLFTEFMSADGYFHNKKGVIKHILHTDVDQPLVAQIFGGDIQSLLFTARDLDKKYNFYAIELNIGCPSPKVMACGGGSFLLRDKDKTLDIIKTLRDNIKTKFTIKTRVGLNDSDKDAQFNFLVKASQYVDMICLHGRTMKQSHSGDVDWDYIYNVKQSITPGVNLVGNGGIKSYSEAYEKLGNLDGVMIGQGSFGNPWVFTEKKPDIKELFDTINLHLDLSLATELYFLQNPLVDETLIMPNFDQLMQIISNFDKELIDSESRLKSIIEFRKHLFWYIRGLEYSAKFKQNVIKIKDYKELKTEISNYFQFFS